MLASRLAGAGRYELLQLRRAVDMLLMEGPQAVAQAALFPSSE